METKETSIKTGSHDRLLQDTEYYKYIFKKTEKISCAVFFILRDNRNISQNDTVVLELESAAQELIDVSLMSLKVASFGAMEAAFEVSYALVALESNLRVAHAARVLGTELLEVFLHEIDSVQRSLRKYTEAVVVNPLAVSESLQVKQRQGRTVARRGEALGAGGAEAGAGGPSRRERILSVIRDKNEASIKDIAEVVTDCSEKTIQRELNSLIKDSIVHREGERRWSRYKLI